MNVVLHDFSEDGAVFRETSRFTSALKPIPQNRYPRHSKMDTHNEHLFELSVIFFSIKRRNKAINLGS